MRTRSSIVLSGLVERHGWTPLNEKCPVVGSCTNADGTIRTPNIIGATKNGMNVTLEPEVSLNFPVRLMVRNRRE